MFPPPSLPVCQCAVYSYVCVQKSDREGQGISESPGCSSWRYSLLSLLPLSDNSGVIQAGVGRAVLGLWWSIMAFRISFPPRIHLILIQRWSTPYTHTHTTWECHYRAMIHTHRSISIHQLYKKSLPKFEKQLQGSNRTLLPDRWSLNVARNAVHQDDRGEKVIVIF